MKEIMVFKNDYEVNDPSTDPKLLKAKERILKYITRHNGTTWGEIGRKFPKMKVADAIEALRTDKLIDYDDVKPAPTRIFVVEKEELNMFRLERWSHSHLYNKPKRRANSFEYI